MLVQRADEHEEISSMLDEAFGVWDLSWRSANDDDHHMMVVVLVDLDDSKWRAVTVRNKCVRTVVSEHNAQVLAHEIGHSFGLGPNVLDLDDHGHDSTPGRLLAVGNGFGWDITAEQAAIVHADVEKFSECKDKKQ